MADDYQYFKNNILLPEDYEALSKFTEEGLISIIEHSKDKLQLLMAFEIGRLKGFAFANDPEPKDETA